MSQSLTQFRLEQKFRQRLYVFAGFMILCGVVMLFQLANLQLVYGFENRVRAQRFVSRREFTRAPRGLMYDRNFRRDGAESLVVRNINYVDFVVHPSRFENRAAGVRYLKQFSLATGIPYSEFEKHTTPEGWKEFAKKNRSITLIDRMSRREQERLTELRVLAEQGEFVTQHLRYYAMGPALAHVSGYIGLPSRKELDQKKALAYQMVGKGGIEQRYDEVLRGTDGVRIRHKIIDTEEQIAVSEHGSNLVLTIDRNVQAAAYRALVKSRKRGTVIALRPTTGEVVALVSNPTFDPNILSSGTRAERSEHYRRVRRHEGSLNLAMHTKFPPGSTFKALVALAALDTPSGAPVTEHVQYTCPGKWVLKSTLAGVPDSEFYCWEHRGHGRQDLVGALAVSCSVYFYQLGYRIGPTPMIEYARAFGLNRKTGIDLPGEVSGFIPDPRWKQLRLSSRWYDGDTVNMAIGQGFLEITPLENAVMFAALINGGKLYRPYLVREVRDPITNDIIEQLHPQKVSEVPVSRSSLDVVHRGMRAMFTRGTTRFLNRPRLPMAGKTGTAQTRSKRGARTHAWFAGWAPYGRPPEDTVLVMVFLEGGGGGSGSAAPIGVEVLEAAFPDYDIRKRAEVGSQGPVFSRPPVARVLPGPVADPTLPSRLKPGPGPAPAPKSVAPAPSDGIPTSPSPVTPPGSSPGER